MPPFGRGKLSADEDPWLSSLIVGLSLMLRGGLKWKRLQLKAGGEVVAQLRGVGYSLQRHLRYPVAGSITKPYDGDS